MTHTVDIEEDTLDAMIQRLRREQAGGRGPEKLILTSRAMLQLEREAEEHWGLVHDGRGRSPSLSGVPIEISDHPAWARLVYSRPAEGA